LQEHVPALAALTLLLGQVLHAPACASLYEPDRQARSEVARTMRGGAVSGAALGGKGVIEGEVRVVCVLLQEVEPAVLKVPAVQAVGGGKKRARPRR